MCATEAKSVVQCVLIVLDKRRANLVRKFYEEAREELLLEYNKPPISEDRNTEYEEKFQIPGFNIKEKMLENDRKVKYI